MAYYLKADDLEVVVTVKDQIKAGESMIIDDGDSFRTAIEFCDPVFAGERVSLNLAELIAND